MKEEQTLDGSPKTAASSTFTAVLSGLDCPDCLGKVRKAAKKLKGVEVVNLDFVRGTAEFAVTNGADVPCFIGPADRQRLSYLKRCVDFSQA